MKDKSLNSNNNKTNNNKTNRKKSTKLANDKYYTSAEVVDRCLEITREVLDFSSITEIIEPAAGNGAFSSKLPNCIAFDIEPENSDKSNSSPIIKQDFLKLELDYQSGRLIIGNPPFGNRNNTSVQFYKKSVQIADYIGFILPISQLNNNLSMYEFDLIKSVDLGLQLYTDRKLQCCYNIYQRPKSGKLNPKPNVKLEDVVIKEYTRGRGNGFIPEDFDFGICNWGNNNIGKKPAYVGQYASEVYFYVKNKAFLDKIKQAVSRETLGSYVRKISISSGYISKGRLYMYLKNTIDGIK